MPTTAPATATATATATANIIPDIAEETIAETATEQASYLLQRALDILIVATPVEISDALPVNVTDTDALAWTVDVLEQHLAVAFEAHHIGCATLEPRMIVATITAVVCPGCIPPADLRAVTRFARRPTRFQRHQFRTDPIHWARVIALTTAAILEHLEDPYELIDQHGTELH